MSVAAAATSNVLMSILEFAWKVDQVAAGNSVVLAEMISSTVKATASKLLVLMVVSVTVAMVMVRGKRTVLVSSVEAKTG